MLSPAYDFVATLPYLPDDQLALTFGGSRSLEGITLDQIRRFTDTAGLPMTPIVRIVRETVEARPRRGKNSIKRTSCRPRF
jgi:serine/threonine-protein kinase HipA